MKQIFLAIILPIILLNTCNAENNVTPSKKDPHYEEVEDLHIEWKDLFLQNNTTYYAYFYTIGCAQCSALREEITTFARSEKAPLYFVFPNDDIPFSKDSTVADASLGATKLEDVYLYSTPTLIEIDNKEITLYTRDFYTIKNIIESYQDKDD